MTKTCKQCGQVFEVHSNHHIYCSKKCRVSNIDSYEKNRYLSKPKKKYAPGKVTCLCCDKKFRSWDKTLNRICPICTGFNEERAVGVDNWVLSTVII